MKTAFYILASLSLGAFSAQAATLWTTTFGNAAQSDPTKVTLTNSGGEMGGITGNVHSLQKTTYSNGQTERPDADDRRRSMFRCLLVYSRRQCAIKRIVDGRDDLYQWQRPGMFHQRR